MVEFEMGPDDGGLGAGFLCGAEEPAEQLGADGGALSTAIALAQS